LTTDPPEVNFALQSVGQLCEVAVELREALAQISEIRHRMAESEIFHGYRSLPVAFSGLLAFGGALLQPYLVDAPAQETGLYCILWTSIAALSIASAGLTMMLRDRFGGASQTREITMMALSQLMPSLAVGALITAIIVRIMPEAAALLPGLWQLLFSLGLFASCRLLPRATYGVALFYLASGAIALMLARGNWAFDPWVMSLPFGVGQLYAAGVLYWNLERTNEKEAGPGGPGGSFCVRRP